MELLDKYDCEQAVTIHQIRNTLKSSVYWDLTNESNREYIQGLLLTLRFYSSLHDYQDFLGCNPHVKELRDTLLKD